MTDIILFDAAEREVYREAAKGNYRRISQEAAARQRQLNAMSLAHPEAVSARIDNFTFVVRNGQSAWTGFVGVAATTLQDNLAGRASF